MNEKANREVKGSDRVCTAEGSFTLTRSVQGGANGYVFVPFQALRLPTNPINLSRSMCSFNPGSMGVGATFLNPSTFSTLGTANNQVKSGVT